MQVNREDEKPLSQFHQDLIEQEGDVSEVAQQKEEVKQDVDLR